MYARKKRNAKANVLAVLRLAAKRLVSVVWNVSLPTGITRTLNKNKKNLLATVIELLSLVLVLQDLLAPATLLKRVMK